MPIQLPAPRFRCRWLAHDRDPIEPLAILFEVVRQLGQGPIQHHDVFGLLEAFDAETGANQIEGEFPLCLAHLEKTRTLTRWKMTVIPFSPLEIAYGVQRLLLLLRTQTGNEGVGRFANRCSRNAACLDLEEPFTDLAVSCHAFEWLRRALNTRVRTLTAGWGLRVLQISDAATKGGRSDECGVQSQTAIDLHIECHPLVLFNLLCRAIASLVKNQLCDLPLTVFDKCYLSIDHLQEEFGLGFRK